MAYKVAKMHDKSAAKEAAIEHLQSLFEEGRYIDAIHVLSERGLWRAEEKLPFYSDLMNMALFESTNPILSSSPNPNPSSYSKNAGICCTPSSCG